MGKPFWAKGSATKAVALIIGYGFAKLDLRRIYAGILEHNSASIKVLEKYGLKMEGIFKNTMVDYLGASREASQGI